MHKSLALLYRHVMYNLRGGFLVRPLIIALALGLLGAIVSWIEEMQPRVSAWLPGLLFPSREDPQVAQVILSGIATSIMTVVSIVFAILLMTLTLASSQFSPRIIVSFSRDRVTQRTLGIFLGTFCYCMAALPAARSAPRPFSPVLTVFGAMALAVACVGWLLFFIHHISHAISVNYIVDRIAAETLGVIDEIMPEPRKGFENTFAAAAAIAWDGGIRAGESGYIRYVDVERLFELTRKYRVAARCVRRVGHFIPAGIELLQISGIARVPPQAHAEFRGAFDLGPSRTLQQDAEFGVLQIVDIALRAISPAINDPSTAINGIDQLSRILIHFGLRQPPPSIFYDLPGVVRLCVPWIEFEGLLDSAFEQIRHYGRGDLAVCLRLLRALQDVASALADPSFRTIAVERGRRVVDGFSAPLTTEEQSALQERLAKLRAIASDPEPANLDTPSNEPQASAEC